MVTINRGAPSMNDPILMCICGHASDEHSNAPLVTGHTACLATDCDCMDFEAEEDDEWDGDEDRE